MWHALEYNVNQNKKYKSKCKTDLEKRYIFGLRFTEK